MDNLYFYNQGRVVPDNAKKPISAGRLKGMTDINPMWRIKRLTEMFGACGIGWWYEITDKQIVCDETTNQKAAFVDILLFFKDPTTGSDSHGIPGTGGSSFVAQENKGPYMSDECFKMALTDAISVAAKSLGIGADVYFDKDRTKYNSQEEQPEVKMETVEDAAGYVLTFGKHNGKTLAEVFKTDRSYLEFLYDGDQTDPVIKKGITILLQAAIRAQQEKQNV
jgi:hypothetical protein